VGGGDLENGEGLRDVRLEPGGELRSGFLVAGHHLAKPPLSLGRLIRLEDAADVARDLWPHGDLGSVGHRVSHKVELPRLPVRSGDNGLPGGLEPAVVLADDEFHTSHAAVDEALEEGSPERLVLGELYAAPKDAPLAVGADPAGREKGTRYDRLAVADFFVAGIEDQVGDLADRSVPPGTELLVELGRRPAHLGGGDVQPAELLDAG
jgi:hypothetical protein